MNDYLKSVEWLLNSKDPSVRYLTLTDIEGKSEASEEVKKIRERIVDGEKVRALLSGQNVDGGFSVHPYRKWTGSHWRLVSLVNLALLNDNPRAIKSAKLSLDWLYSSGIDRSFKEKNGKVRMHASVYGNAVYYFCYFGLAEEPRVKKIIGLIQKSQWEDGGWNCDPNPEATHSSFHESLATLNGLIAYYNITRDKFVKKSIDKAADLFLSHHIFKSHHSGKIIMKEWLKLRYPVYWHYNFLEAMRVLCLAGKGSDDRMEDSLDLLEKKCDSDGRWTVEGHYWSPIEKNYLSTSKSLPSREVVDWGWIGPNEMITLNALRVLKATGRVPKGMI